MAPITDLNKTASDDAQVVQLEDATTGNTLGVTATNEAKVSVTQPLPAGTNILGSIINVSGTVSLPTGAATSANQTSEIALLTAIDAGIPVALGQTTMSASMPVAIASNQSTIPVQGVNLAVPFPSATINAGNSTSALLTSGSTFTGAWVDVTSFSNMTLIVFADQASATDGLVFEFSTNGVNVDDNDMYSIMASSGQQISVPLVAQYVRIRYVNGGTNQGVFRLQSKFHGAYPKGSSQRIGTPINNEQDAELVLSVIARQPLTASAPTASSVGVASAQAVASNANRKGLTLVNTSTASISLGFGATAVLNSGVTIYPGGSWEMDVFNFNTGAVNAIASAAASNLAIQEFT